MELQGYVLSQKGQILGPLQKEDLLNSLKTSKVHWDDLVMVQQEPAQWIHLVEHREFKPYFYKWFVPGPSEDIQLLGEWYILQKDKECGPFAYLDLIKFLQVKKIAPENLVWNKSFEVWKPIYECSEFSAPVIKSLMKTADPTISRTFFRRRYERIEYQSEIIVHQVKKTFKGESIEISPGGAGVWLDTSDLESGQTVFLHFKAALTIPSFNAVCLVVNRDSIVQGQRLVRYGMQFTSIMKSVQEAIQNCKSRRLA